MKTSIKLSDFISFFKNLKFSHFIFSWPSLQRVFVFCFSERKGGKKILCRQQFGYQVLFSSVFLKPLILVIIILTVLFYAIITIIIIIHWELLCVCIYIERDNVFIQKGKDCLSGPAEIWFLKNVLKATLEIRVRDVNILLNHPITDLHDAICVQ